MCELSDSLGLSIGTTNLVAARVGSPPIVRRAVLNLFGDRAPCLGASTEDCGVTLTGFVERVGDPIPLIAPDGSAHRGEAVLAEALDSMARTAGGGAPIVIAAPAHWGMSTIGALSAALRGKPGLAAAPVVSDAAAALAGLKAGSGLPDHGVVALCDFGGSGTSVTIADAATLSQIGETVRYPEFSGDLVEFDATPYAGDAYFQDWPHTLDRVLALGGADGRYVPGHGAVVDAAFVRAQRDWLTSRC